MIKPDQAEMDRPFPGLPLCSRYLAIGPIEEARQRVCRMLDRGEALGVVMGPPGTGKSLLCQKIASLYRHSHAIVSLGEMRVSSRLGLIQQVLFHLGKPHQGDDEEALHLVLVQSLTKSAGGLRPLLLIIDEAQMLSAELLDEVRMMTNLVRDGRPMVQTLLVGGPRLEETLADPQLESLTQRIAVRCYLHPLTQHETEQYVRAAMSMMALPVDDQAIASVHHASAGIARLINQLMDQAIEVARSRRKSRLDDHCVQIAWADLQQLPSPVLEAELRPHSATIEFGELDDADAFDFENEATPVKPASHSADTDAGHSTDAGRHIGAGQYGGSHYADIASILDSTSIDCLPQSLHAAPRQDVHAAPLAEITGRGCDAPMAAQPSQAKRTAALHSTAPQRTATPLRTPAGDELFGADFDQETPLDVASVRFPSQSIDPAQEELSLHEEIRRLSAAAESTFGDANAPQRVGSVSGLAGVLDRAMLSPPHGCDLPEELACPLSVVWSDEEVVPLQGDDRDILVIEDDVRMMIDSPQSGTVASGAMRKPPHNIDQSFQNLFSRLRGGQ